MERKLTVLMSFTGAHRLSRYSHENSRTLAEKTLAELSHENSLHLALFLWKYIWVLSPQPHQCNTRSS